MIINNLKTNPFDPQLRTHSSGAEIPQTLESFEVKVRDGTESLTATEAFLRLNFEHFRNELRIRFDALLKGDALDVITASWWAGCVAIQSPAGSVNIEGDLEYTLRDARKKTEQWEEEVKMFTLFHARSAWMNGYRAAKRSQHIGLLTPVWLNK